LICARSLFFASGNLSKGFDLMVLLDSDFCFYFIV
jgi:hypothetical protein